MNSFCDKTVLITGAAGGLGLILSRCFLEDGARVILTDIRADALAAARADLAARGLKETGVLVSDLSTREGCEALHAQVLATHGPVDVLVNNAGINTMSFFTELPFDEMEAILAVNLLAPLRLTRLFLPAMIERERGHVVFMASAAALLMIGGSGTYVATKAGLRGFGESLADEVVTSKVQVSTVYPFFTDTKFLDQGRVGSMANWRFPAKLLDDPEVTMREVYERLKKGHVHILPGRAPKLMRAVTGLLPEPAIQVKRMIFQRVLTHYTT